MNYIKRLRFFPVFTILLVSFLLFNTRAQAQPDGKGLFTANCAQCHYIGKGVLIGPDLQGVDKRRPEAWLLKWVKSSQSVVKSGDAYAVEIFNKFNKTVMPDFALSDDEIKAIVTYTKTAAPKPKGPEGPGGPGVPEQPTDWTTWLIIIAVVLFTVAVMLAKLKRTLNNVVREREGLPTLEKIPVLLQTWLWMKRNKKAVALIFIGLMIWGSVVGWYTLKGIGVSEGYQPDQPIAFSHKIHAGDNGISCVYCHSGAEKGKTAGVPSANVCMNCHKGIKEGKTTGTEEIAKIYKALDVQADGSYGKNQKPLQWVRVHNLPDFAYFNHSQHVKVGGQQCQTCHGPVQEMTVAKQFSPLTMGWCIDCHRSTEVKMDGNHYYDEYHKTLQAKYGKDKKITVEAIGGTECARCHY